MRPSPPDVAVPNGGFSFDTTLKSFGPKPNSLKIQFQPPSLVRYFTPRDDGNFTSEQGCAGCILTSHLTFRRD